MSRSASFALAIILVLVVLAPTQEPVKPKLTPTIITATRQVALFSGLEKQLIQAVQKKDKDKLQAFLADEFIIDMPDADSMPGDDWMASVLAEDFSLKSFVLRQFAVDDLGNAAVVKFDRIQESTYKGKSDGGEFFVVDLWKKAGDAWKLSNRYVSKVSSVPEIPQKAPRPTGKQ
jgi:hypothetical protein